MKKKLGVFLILSVFCLVFTGCTILSKKQIIGKWESKVSGYSFVYTFNKDNTCSYNAAGTIMECTYKIDGKKISISYKGIKESFDTTFSIDGDKLNIKDSFGKDTIYNRK